MSISKSQNIDNPLANLSEKILKINSVVEAVQLSRPTIYRLASEGKFPRPVKLSSRASGWFASDISEWISALKEVAK
jgi:prophage regulatory protein